MVNSALTTMPIGNSRETGIFRQARHCCSRVITLRQTVPQAELYSWVYMRIYAKSRGPINASLWDAAFVESVRRQVPDRLPVTFPIAPDAPDVAVLDGVEVELPADATIANGQATVWVSAMDIGNQPGFMARTSENGPPSKPARIYLSARPAHAVAILGPLSRRLERGLSHGWAAKVVANPQAFGRTDAAVVYVEVSELDRAVREVVDGFAYLGLSPLRKSVPLFTARVSSGVSVAAEPPVAVDRPQLSHGMWVTECLIRATEETGSGTVATRRLDDILLSHGRSLSDPSGLGVLRVVAERSAHR